MGDYKIGDERMFPTQPWNNHAIMVKYTISTKFMSPRPSAPYGTSKDS